MLSRGLLDALRKEWVENCLTLDVEDYRSSIAMSAIVLLSLQGKAPTSKDIQILQTAFKIDSRRFQWLDSGSKKLITRLQAKFPQYQKPKFVRLAEVEEFVHEAVALLIRIGVTPMVTPVFSSVQEIVVPHFSGMYLIDGDKEQLTPYKITKIVDTQYSEIANPELAVDPDWDPMPDYLSACSINIKMLVLKALIPYEDYFSKKTLDGYLDQYKILHSLSVDYQSENENFILNKLFEFHSAFRGAIKVDGGLVEFLMQSKLDNLIKPLLESKMINAENCNSGDLERMKSLVSNETLPSLLSAPDSLCSSLSSFGSIRTSPTLSNRTTPEEGFNQLLGEEQKENRSPRNESTLCIEELLGFSQTQKFETQALSAEDSPSPAQPRTYFSLDKRRINYYFSTTVPVKTPSPIKSSVEKRKTKSSEGSAKKQKQEKVKSLHFR